MVNGNTELQPRKIQVNMGLRINTDYFHKQHEPVFICHKNAMCFPVSENQYLNII